MCNETVRHPNITALWHVPPALFASLVLLMAATKKGRKWFGRWGAISRHTTKLKQSIFLRYLWTKLMQCLCGVTAFGPHFRHLLQQNTNRQSSQTLRNGSPARYSSFLGWRRRRRSSGTWKIKFRTIRFCHEVKLTHKSPVEYWFIKTCTQNEGLTKTKLN